MEDPIFILDIGTHSIKCGLSVEDPKFVPSVVCGDDVGERALEKLADLKEDVSCPLLRDWDHIDADMLISDTYESFAENHKDFKSLPVLATEPFFNLPKNSKFLMEEMFETLGVKSYYCFPAPLLCIHASPIETGMILDIGHYFTQSVIFRDRLPKWRTIKKQSFGGKNLTQIILDKTNIRMAYLSKELGIKEEKIQSALDMIVGKLTSNKETKKVFSGFMSAEEIKVEKLGIPTKDIVREKKRVSFMPGDVDEVFQEPIEFKLPDGTMIDVDVADLNGLGEMVYFTPDSKYRSPNEMSIQQQIFSTCAEYYEGTKPVKDQGIKEQMYSKIVLAGGMSQMKGFAKRLEYEIQYELKRSKVEAKAKIHAGEGQSCQTMAFQGGKLISGLSSVRNEFFTSQQFEEDGVDKLLGNMKLWHKSLY